MIRSIASFASIAVAITLASASVAAEPVRVGSKRFTESYVIAEIVVALAREEGREEGLEASHVPGLGGTAITYRALSDGAIDVYPEYTGTIAETIVRNERADVARLRAALAPQGIGVSDPLGFENTYALAASRDAAAAGLARISDLATRPELRIAMSHELAGRTDGWPGLARRYGLEGRAPSVIDHALAYEAIAERRVDVIDVYTTDAKIERQGLVVLDDDRAFFPRYEAVLLYRRDAVERHPALERVLRALAGSLDAPTMRRLNARVELDGASFQEAAAEHLEAKRSGRAPSIAAGPRARPGSLDGLGRSIVRHGPRHLGLVLGALALSVAVGLPLGILAHARRRVGAVILGAAGVVQTIPSLALFCFFIPLLGIGPAPALGALFLYGLLPIVRNTHAGLGSIPADLRDAARALGLSSLERMRHVELPLASPTILAGVKTSAVVAVGSATIAAFIGAGGFGEPISTGLSLNDIPTILDGAVPAAGLALAIQAAFSLLERAVVPKGLRFE